MSNKLKTLLAAATLGLMLTPAILMAAEGKAKSPDDHGQYSEEANPSSSDQMESSGDTENGDESAAPEDSQGSEDMAPEDGTTDDSEDDLAPAE